MSAGGLARLGVRCESPATGIATLGIYCGLGVVVAQERTGGHQFLAFKPILNQLKKQIPVDAEIITYYQTDDKEFVIDGKTYALVAKRTPKEIIDETPGIDSILADAANKMGVTRRNAKKKLYNQIIKVLKEAESIKESTFIDDEELIMILVATDDL
jgi:hypothetical protein